MFFWRKKIGNQSETGNLKNAQIAHYKEKGYLIIETGINSSTIDSIINDLDPYWKGKEINGVPHPYPSRIQDAWKFNKDIQDIANNKKVLGALFDLYNRSPMPFQTLNFPKGTEQPVHSDSIHFNSEPFGLMCGVWVALEDVGPGQGPLIYYPGSNKWPEMNFEELDLRPSYDEYHHYVLKLQQRVEESKLKPSYGTMHKGQALIWAANLIHGGSVQYDKSLSRHSQVTHYFFEGSKPWRPGHSEAGRAYFTPEWIPLT